MDKIVEILIDLTIISRERFIKDDEYAKIAQEIHDHYRPVGGHHDHMCPCGRDWETNEQIAKQKFKKFIVNWGLPTEAEMLKSIYESFSGWLEKEQTDG